MPVQVVPGSVLSQKLWGAAVTLYTESQCVLPHLYGSGPDAIIHVEDRQDIADDGRGSIIEFKYGDRNRGSAIGPKALGATGFGQEQGQRPIYNQTMNMQAQELATTGFLNTVVGQTYTNVPLEKKELRDCGAESAEVVCRSLHYHQAGITAYNTSAYSPAWSQPPCGNLVTEMDTAHQFWTGGLTSDTAVAAQPNAILTVEFLETAITKLQSRAWVRSPMAPGKTPWGEFFVVLVDGEGAEQLARHSSTNRYTQLTLAEIQGGNAPDKVASFMQANQGFQATRGMLVIVDEYVPFGQSGTTPNTTTAGTQIGNVRRAEILGRFAMHVKWGQGFDAESTHIKASNFVMHQQESWKFFTHWGGVETLPTSDPIPQRFGTATVSYYVAAPTPIY